MEEKIHGKCFRNHLSESANEYIIPIQSKLNFFFANLKNTMNVPNFFSVKNFNYYAKIASKFSQAQFILFLYFSGNHITEKDEQSALYYLNLSSYPLAVVYKYFLGEGVDLHRTKALNFLEKFEPRGKIEIMLKFTALGDFYEKQDLKLAVEYYREARKFGNYYSILKYESDLSFEAANLGVIYAYELIYYFYLEENKFYDAFRYAHFLVSKRYKSFLCFLAEHLYLGKGCKRDCRMAIEIFKEDASPKSLVWLSQIYGSVDYCQKACEKDPYYNYKLGDFYLFGIGIPKDINRAIELYKSSLNRYSIQKLMETYIELKKYEEFAELLVKSNPSTDCVFEILKYYPIQWQPFFNRAWPENINPIILTVFRIGVKYRRYFPKPILIKILAFSFCSKTS